MGQLTNNELVGDFTDIITLDFEDIKSAGTTATAFATIPAGGGVDVAMVFEAEATAGATDITLNVGTTIGDPDEFIDALDVDAMGVSVANTGESFVQAAGNTTIAGGSLPVALNTADTLVYYKFGGTTGDLTAGKFVIGLRVLNLGRFA
ncbi:MAG: hypothetical protein CMI27_01950 [Opitutae bacterium]|nr:hypothetical protein [Opitutae bacterium]|tara:strand:+ start:2173 stop:2619 length:447 start_codon:yes stop_codon:yes gene_type:complete